MTISVLPATLLEALPHPSVPESATEIAENVASIEAVPLDVLPRDFSRLLLTELAQAGLGVSCYQSGGPLGVWVAWLEPLARIRADKAGRIPLEAWRRDWFDVMMELRLAPIVEHVQRHLEERLTA